MKTYPLLQSQLGVFYDCLKSDIPSLGWAWEGFQRYRLTGCTPGTASISFTALLFCANSINFLIHHMRYIRFKIIEMANNKI